MYLPSLVLVGAVEVRAAVGRVRPALVDPGAGRGAAEHACYQRCRAVDHRGIDDLPLAGFFRLEQTADQAKGEIERAATEIADEIERRNRHAIARANRMQRADQRDVVDVVTGGLRQRPLLPPAGHAAVHELWIGLEAFVRPEAKALHHAGPEAFDQCISFRHQLPGDLDVRGLLQVERDRAAAARQKIVFGFDGIAEIGRLGAIDADDVGAHVGEQHAAERPRADAGELDDFNSL